MPSVSIGRIVHYVLTAEDAERINRRRTTSRAIAERIEAGQWPLGAQAHIGNPPYAGQELPMIVAVVWPNEYGPNYHGVNGQVTLDGNDAYWVTSAKEGAGPGTWHWPERVE